MIKNVRTTKEFDRSLKKLRKKHYEMSQIAQAVFHIAHGDQDTLIRKYKWHKLKGDKAGINEIHLDRDWLLLYEITDNEITILLLDTGSHDSVFSVYELKMVSFYLPMANRFSQMGLQA